MSARGHSRIDKIYVNKSNSESFSNFKYQQYLESDHTAVLVEYNKIKSKETPIKSPYWKLNTLLLEDEDYLINMKKK